MISIKEITEKVESVSEFLKSKYENKPFPLDNHDIFIAEFLNDIEKIYLQNVNVYLWGDKTLNYKQDLLKELERKKNKVFI